MTDEQERIAHYAAGVISSAVEDFVNAVVEDSTSSSPFKQHMTKYRIMQEAIEAAFISVMKAVK